jgi:hypothetical protein
MTTAFVRPATGLTVPNTDMGVGVYFDPAGETVEVTSAVQRLIDGGDLIVSTPAGPDASRVVLSEANGSLSRDSITVGAGAGTLVVGTVLGKDSEHGKYFPSPATASDGTDTAVAVLLFPVEATTLDVTTSAVTNYAEIAGAELTYDASVNDDTKKALKATQLRAVGIKMR